jgi:hypothetical protein
MSVAVVQSATAQNGGGGAAPIVFADAPTAGNLLLFLLGAASNSIGDFAADEILTLAAEGAGPVSAGLIYCRRVQSGDPIDYGFGFNGGAISVIGLELSGATGSVGFFDATPAWSSGAVDPASDGQPSVTPSDAATGGLAISFLITNGDVTASESSPWTGGYSAVQTNQCVFADVAAATPGEQMTASWDLSGDTYWTGAVFVISAQSGVDTPTASAGGAQYALANAAVTLPGSATTAEGHTATYAWTSPALSAPAITSGADSLTATIASTGSPQAITAYTYQLTVTQDDGQTAVAQMTLTVAPPASFNAYGDTVIITHVQDQVFSTDTGSTDSATVDIDTAAGNTLVVSVWGQIGSDTALTLTSVTDSTGEDGNTWTYSAEANSQSPPAAGSFDAAIGYYGFCAVGVCIGAEAVASVTVGLSAEASELYVIVSEFAGVPAGAVLDGAASSDAYAIASSVTASIEMASRVGLAVAVSASQFGWSAADAPYTLVGGGAAWALTLADGPQSATLTLGYDNQVNAWAMLGIGDPDIVYQGWYGTNPVLAASGGEWS